MFFQAKNVPKPFLAGYLWTPLGELTTLPQTTVDWRGKPLPISLPSAHLVHHHLSVGPDSARAQVLKGIKTALRK